jgi:hypothetical protein
MRAGEALSSDRTVAPEEMAAIVGVDDYLAADQDLES